MKNILYTSCIFIAFCFTSCKDFLDYPPTNSGDAETAIQTAADAQVIMRGIMRKMSSGDYYGRNFPLYGDTKGGDITIIAQGRGYDYLYVFNHSESSNSYSSIWSQGYHCLADINNLLASIEKIKAAGSTENFDNFVGQALTARALIYFDLVRLYGEPYNENKSSYGVPITLSLLNAEDNLLRNTVEENYTQILKDLKDAETLIVKPTNAATLTSSRGFLNYYANKAIQARVYLYMEDFPSALSAAEEVINSNLYTLYSNDNWVSSWASEFGTESIFELGIYANEGDLNTTSLGAYYRRRAHGSSSFLGNFTASDYYLARLNEVSDDVRMGVMAADETSSTRLGASYKYSGSTALAGDKKTTNSTAVNIKVVRLSEIYLIAAEAAFRQPSVDLTKTVTYLNAIRKRAVSLAPATTATVSLDMIANERSKELFTEGHRYFDMIRWNKTIEFNDEFGDISTIHREKTIDRTFFKTILPIPLAEINANPEIGNQQNTGY
ncbi:RagB/SusD family nutrient uptake outer membrane protein [Sphingobacterium hungaricum]